jgi:hypothetical protein
MQMTAAAAHNSANALPPFELLFRLQGNENIIKAKGGKEKAEGRRQ